MGKRELVALLSSSSWCLVIVVWLSLAVPWASLQFVIVVFPDHTHLLFMAHSNHTSFGVVGWTVVCDCGISWSSLLVFKDYYYWVL